MKAATCLVPASGASPAAGPSHENLSEALRTVAINSSFHASRALSKWFKRGVRLTSEGFTSLNIHDASSALGDPDQVIVAVRMNLGGELQGDVVLTMPEVLAFRLIDFLMMSPAGTTQTLGEMEASCLQETGNIVASAFTNCLSHWLMLQSAPQAPVVVHDLACAIIEPLLMAQAELADEALIARTTFELDGESTDWGLMLLPSAHSLEVMRRQCRIENVRRSALHTIAINGAFEASRALSKWFHRGVQLTTDGFQRMPIRDLCTPELADQPVVALEMPLSDQLHGHALLLISMPTAVQLAEILLETPRGEPGGGARELSELELSCLQETGNILGSSFVNNWCRWLDIHAEPGVPQIRIDLRESILSTLILEQARVSDDLYFSRTQFSMDHQKLEWEFYLLPTPTSLRLIEASCTEE